MVSAAPLPTPAKTSEGQQAYLPPGHSEWLALTAEAFKLLKITEEVDKAQIQSNLNALSDMFAGTLQMPNLGFFAGSGTSLGKVGGPSMWKLWEQAMCIDEQGTLSSTAMQITEKVRYTELESPNIEHFLSHCDAYLAFNNDQEVSAFVNTVKELILRACTDFIGNPSSDLSAYRELLQKLARRRVRDPRLKVFTTNYDMCFETAASDLGMITVDGFSYTRKRRFDGKHFSYDIVRRNSDGHEFAEGIYQLLKLHGSVSWIRENTEIYEHHSPNAENACLIYPAKGKYQQAFLQPHLELLSRFIEFLRQPNSCLMVAGFGFNDDHLSEPIYSAIQSNPSLKLILCDFRCINHLESPTQQGTSPYWGKLHALALKGFDIHFINASFNELVNLIPHLRSASPAEQLANAVRRVGVRE